MDIIIYLKNNDVQVGIQVKRFEHFDFFFQMLRDGWGIDGFCWKSKNTDLDFSRTI